MTLKDYRILLLILTLVSIIFVNLVMIYINDKMYQRLCNTIDEQSNKMEILNKETKQLIIETQHL